MIELPIAGSQTLEQIRLKCGTTENLEICKLVHLRKLPVVGNKRRNRATFVEVDIEEEVPDLFLVAIPPGGDVSEVIAEQLAEGRHLIFNETVFVENEEKRVAGFR